MKKITALIFLVLIIAVGVVFYTSNNFVVTSSYEIESTKIPSSFDGFKIVQLSDLHSKDHGGKVERIVDKENPDIVIITGDMVNANDSQENFATFLEVSADVASKYDTYFVEGNHETALPSEDFDYLKNEMIAQGITVLDNEYVAITKDDGSYINIYGLWYNLRYYNDMSDENSQKYYFDLDDMVNLIGNSNPDAFNLVAAHNPLYFDTYVDWGADLILSGHMHGGMVRIPFVGGVISPERVTFPEYDAGLFEKVGPSGTTSSMIVNRGLGNGTSGFRFWNWPDVSVITLNAG